MTFQCDNDLDPAVKSGNVTIYTKTILTMHRTEQVYKKFLQIPEYQITQNKKAGDPPHIDHQYCGPVNHSLSLDTPAL